LPAIPAGATPEMSRRPPNTVEFVSAAVASKPRNVKPLGVPTLPEMFPDATMAASPTPRLSAWMPVEVILGPLQVTLAA
jgi:hypothetical protein